MTATVERGAPGAQRYVELPPRPELARAVRTVWIQEAGGADYLQRHLPTGGFELHVPIGLPPRVLGPLTGPLVEVIPAGTVLVGVRFHPCAASRLAVAGRDLLGRHVPAEDVWGAWAARLAGRVEGAPTAMAALDVVQGALVAALRGARPADPLVSEAVRRLMPWTPQPVASVAADLGISTSQLWRRRLREVGLGPKVLQRILRFQGFLALTQAGARASGRRGDDGLVGLAVDVGYSDHAHLARECRRLTGLSPRQLLGGDGERCLCGHDHAASYRPFLAGRAASA